MDFVISFFKNRIYGKTYNAILVIINKFFKIIYYIFYRKNFTAGDFAEFIVREIIRFYKKNLIIVLNRATVNELYIYF